MNCYRYRQSVAVSGRYMTPKTARRLARQLYAIARDVESNAWGEQSPPSIDLEAFRSYEELEDATARPIKA